MPVLAAAALPAAPYSGLVAAIILAAGVTALAALGMTIVGLHRTARLTAVRALAAGGVGLGVVAIAAAGVLAISPAAQATADETPRLTYVVTGDGLDVQLPTLPLDD